MYDRGRLAMNRQHGASVTFKSGPFVSDPFDVRRKPFENEAFGQEIGIEIRVIKRTYYLPAEFVLVGGEVFEPRTGDRIIEGAEEYEIFPPDEATAAVSPFNGGLEWEVHTKKVA